ncbi:MAG: hypothetical protein Q9191_001146 [Dirinaria sp. TL-2023a]
MAPPTSKKRKLDDDVAVGASKFSKKPRRKQQQYPSLSGSSSSSSSEHDFVPVSLADSDGNDSPASAPRVSSPSPSAASGASDSPSSSSNSIGSRSSSLDTSPSKTDRKPKKRNDPTAFSAAIHKILSSKLSSSKRADPVLARSASAQEASTTLANVRLETKAKQKLREEKKASLERGRVKDVLLGTDIPKGGPGRKTEDVRGEQEDVGGGMNAGEVQEQERRLRKTAQKGVVKLFNAVRAAQVRGEEAAKKARGGRTAREERIAEMGREGFLELIAGGGRRGGKGSETAEVAGET